jgi:GTP cyclohydrolase IA
MNKLLFPINHLSIISNEHEVEETHANNNIDKHTLNEAEAKEAVRTLINWAGDNPSRSGVLETPKRVLKSYGEIYGGYKIDPIEYLNKTFDEVHDYCEPVIVSDINFFSTCEHHMLPFFGVAHVGYIPKERVVGLSKLCRVVNGYSRRLQVQERLTQQIADALCAGLATDGVAVVIEAVHMCMSIRGARSENSRTTTMALRGGFKNDPNLEERFFRTISRNNGIKLWK